MRPSEARIYAQAFDQGLRPDPLTERRRSGLACEPLAERSLASLIERSITATDAIARTADKIGVGVEALQELRYAAKAPHRNKFTFMGVEAPARQGARNANSQPFN